MIKKLVDKIVETNAPIVVGLDPMMKYLALLMAVSQRKRSGISRLAIGPPSFAPEHILSKTWRFAHKDSLSISDANRRSFSSST